MDRRRLEVGPRAGTLSTLMAISREYTPKKRVLMQVAMWLILLAMLGLAGLVTRQRQAAMDIKLSETLTHEGITLSLPKDWKVTRYSPDDGPLLLKATHPKEPRKALLLRRDWFPYRGVPIVHLLDRLNPKTMRLITDGEPLVIGGNPGVKLIAASVSGTSFDELTHDIELTVHYLAGTIPPSGRGIMLELTSPELEDIADSRLLEKVAASIKLPEKPPTDSPREIDLSAAVSLTVPLAAMESTDALTTSRLWRSVEPDKTMRIATAAPIVMRRNDSVKTLRTMVSIMEPTLTDGTIRALDKNQWVIEPPAGNLQEYCPQRGYAMVNDAGHGVLIVFEGGDSPDWIQSAWEKTQDSIRFNDAANLSDLTERAAAEVSRLRELNLSQLAAEKQTEQWWMLQLDKPSRPLGWTHILPREDVAGETMETRIRLPQRWVQKREYSWQVSTNRRGYRMNMQYSHGEDESTPELDMGSKSTAQLQGDEIRLTSRGREAGGSDESFAPPANYLPGGMLPALVGKLGDENLLIRTDSLIGYEYARATDLHYVLIQPHADAKLEQGWTCKRVELIGSGEAARWYYRPDGQLDRIESSDGFVQARQDEADIRREFDSVPFMKPQRSEETP